MDEQLSSIIILQLQVNTLKDITLDSRNIIKSRILIFKTWHIKKKNYYLNLHYPIIYGAYNIIFIKLSKGIILYHMWCLTNIVLRWYWNVIVYMSMTKLYHEATILLNIFLLEMNFDKSTIGLHFFLIYSMLANFLENWRLFNLQVFVA